MEVSGKVLRKWWLVSHSEDFEFNSRKSTVCVFSIFDNEFGFMIIKLTA